MNKLDMSRAKLSKENKLDLSSAKLSKEIGK